jgi:hypothetical protein
MILYHTDKFVILFLLHKEALLLFTAFASGSQEAFFAGKFVGLSDKPPMAAKYIEWGSTVW